MGIFGSTLHGFLHFSLAFSRLSDSGEDAKVKGTRKVGGAGKGKKKGVHAFSIQRTQLSRSLEVRLLSLWPT